MQHTWDDSSMMLACFNRVESVRLLFEFANVIVRRTMALYTRWAGGYIIPMP